MNEAFEKAKKVLSVVDVTLRESYVSLDENVDIKNFDISKLDIQAFRTVSKVRETSIQLKEKEVWEYDFFYSCGIRLINKSDSEDEVEEDNSVDISVEIKATFSAKYRAEEKVEKELIEAFSEENVGYHVWPYWRELVQSSCSRLNITHLETPFYFCSNK